MAAVYTKQEQRACLFTAVEGIHSLDFKTERSDAIEQCLLLRDALKT